MTFNGNLLREQLQILGEMSRGQYIQADLKGGFDVAIHISGQVEKGELEIRFTAAHNQHGWNRIHVDGTTMAEAVNELMRRLGYDKRVNTKLLPAPIESTAVEV